MEFKSNEANPPERKGWGLLIREELTFPRCHPREDGSMAGVVKKRYKVD